MRRRGIVWLGAEKLADLLRLKPGQSIVSVFVDPYRMTFGVAVEGEGMPECEPGGEPVAVSPDGFVDLELRAKLAALSARYVGERDGTASADVLAKLDAVLSGDLDPRVDMPS